VPYGGTDYQYYGGAFYEPAPAGQGYAPAPARPGSRAGPAGPRAARAPAAGRASPPPRGGRAPAPARAGQGYVTVPARVGAAVEAPPLDCTVVFSTNSDDPGYCYFQGAFFIYDDQSDKD